MIRKKTYKTLETVLSKEEIFRYNRQMLLPEVGEAGQERLKNTSVLVIGAGGLGAPILLYLAAAGVGHLGIVDADRIELSNLQRQILFETQQIGQTKTTAAIQKLKALNPHIELSEYTTMIHSQNALELISSYDLILDGSDNLATRYLVNDACFFTDKPLIYGAIFRFEGQVSLFNAALPNGERGPNYRDLFPTPPPPDMVPNCADGGVLGVLPGVIGSMMASEAVKYILQKGTSLSGRLFVWDALDFSTYELSIEALTENPLRGKPPQLKQLIDYEAFCASAVTSEVKILEITVEEFETARMTEKILLLDVREPHEFKLVNLGGISIPLGELAQRCGELDKEAKIICICKTGVRSKEALLLLQKQGFGHTFNLQGGLMAYQEQVDPTLPRY